MLAVQIAKPSRRLPPVLQSWKSFPTDLRRSVLLLGNFDGYHRGHEALYREASQIAGRRGAPVGIMSVEPHPRQFFDPGSVPFRLTGSRSKPLILGGSGCNFLFCPPFNRAFANLMPLEFIQAVLVDGLNVSGVVCGDDFRFGLGRKGDVSTLRESSKLFGFSVSVAPTVREQGVRCSSESIRNFLRAGSIFEANRMLGRNWILELAKVDTQRSPRCMRLTAAPGALIPPPDSYQCRLTNLPGDVGATSGRAEINHGQILFHADNDIKLPPNNLALVPCLAFSGA